jgi:hypothetical protein
LAAKEARQTFDVQGLWADLLSSVTMCFNLFGDLAADLALADRAVHTWWPDAPGTVSDVRFAYSPGRLDLSYIGSLVTFDVAFVLDLGDGTQGVVAVDTKFHEHTKREVPKPSRLERYREVSEKSGAFAPGAIDAISGDLTVMWLEHLLMLSMLQHPSATWSWGRYLVVHPAGNTAFADAAARYRTLLASPGTFSTVTVEDLLGASALPSSTVAAVRDRYEVFRHRTTHR